MKSKQFAVYTVLIVASVFLAILLYAQTVYKEQKANTTIVYSQNGVWDLRNIDFADGLVLLEGNVEHIEGEILSPSQFEEMQEHALYGNPIDYNTARTARLTVLTPDDSIYMMYTGWGDFARKIYINGEYYASSGTVSPTAEGFVPGYKRLTAQAKAEDEKLEFIIQGGNFVHREGTSYSYIYLGTPDFITWYMNFHLIIEAMTAGIFLSLFLVYLVLAIITKKYRLNLYFSALNFTWFIRLGLVGSKFLYDIFPELPWVFAIKLEYITMAITAFFIAKIICLHMSKIVHVKVMQVAGYLFLGMALLFCFIDTITMSYFVPISTILFIMLCTYVTVCMVVKLFFKKMRHTITFEQSIVMIAMFIMFICIVNDGLFFINVFIARYTLLETGILIFALFEAIAIFCLDAKALEKSRYEEEKTRIRALELERFLEMKSHFIGIVAHEIKTPLAIIMGAVSDTVDIIEEETKSNKDEILRNQRLIKETVKKVNETVFDLLDTTALETGRMGLVLQRVDLKTLIKDIVELYKIQIEKSANKLVLSFEEECGAVMADEKRMRQVLLNLISNACRHAELSTITISLWQEGTAECISVSDDGAGISKDTLAKLKNSYVDGGPHGYRGGIGIYVCNQIIMSHGGTFDIESQEQVGTKITIKLPIKGPENGE